MRAFYRVCIRVRWRKREERGKKKGRESGRGRECETEGGREEERVSVSWCV